jgi:16S rRNA (guanine527-N7)-methyltransferase
LLLRWNQKINLTAITEPEQILKRHFAESFAAAPYLPEREGLLCDIGSGAGFPGLALKLIRPGWTIRLYEPVAKKAAFLREAAHALDLRGVTVSRERWGDARLTPSSVDAVTARALGEYRKMSGWAKSVLRPGGKLLLWLGGRDAERMQTQPGWTWSSGRLPNAKDSYLLVGVSE